MVTENVDIRFRESGAVVIKRRIDEIGNAANRATRGIFLLQRAIFVLGGAGIVRGLIGYVDALTAMENRLRLTSTSTENLEAVQRELLGAANRSRTDFLALGEVYTRMALSARDLGASQREILDFTETLSKASIISGANAQEARAALIQLGQGLASNRLSGDELRSVLEQLPFVADIIAREAGVTRGELRELGRTGQLTAQVVLDAFRNAKDEIDALFETTQPTIGQAFAVAQNNLLAFIDRIDDASGASAKIANAIIFLSGKLDILLAILAAVAIRFAASFGASIIQRVIGIVNVVQRLGGATAALAAIETKRAANSVALRSATAAQNAADLRAFQIRQQRIAQSLVLRQAEFQEAAAAFQNGRARDLQTGKFIATAAARDRLTQATIRLTAAERANQIATAQVNSLRTASIAADNAAAASRTRLAAATAAQATFTSRLSATFPLLTGVVRGAGAAVGGLFALLAANPIGAAIAAVIGLVTAFVLWGNEIKVTSDGVVGLKDAVIAAFQLMGEAIAPFLGPIWEGIKTAVRTTKDALVEAALFIGRAFFQAVEIIIDSFTFIPRVVVGVVVGIIAALRSMPGEAGQVAMQLANALIAGFEAFANGAIEAINKVIRAINSLLAFVGADKAAEWFGFSGQLGEIANVALPRFETAAGSSGQRAAEAFTEGFSTVFEGGRVRNLAGTISDLLAPIGDRIIERARQNIADREGRQGEVTTGDRPPGTPGAGDGAGGRGRGGANQRTFAEELAALEQAIQLEKQYGLQKAITTQILQVEQAIKRQLTDTEREQIANAVTLLEIAKIQGEVLQDILGPQERLILGQAALNELFAEGAITLEQYNTKLREMQIAADRAANTVGGGFRAAIAGAIQSAGQFGEAIGGAVVNAVNAAADAIVEFARTGRLNLRQLFADLFAQLLKLAAQRLLLSFLGSFLGIPGASLLGGGGGGLLGFSAGGSILPSGPGSTDTQIVSFAKRPDERVDILTPQQQAAQRNNGNGGGSGPTIVQSPPVNVAAVLSPGDIVRAFDNSDGETLVINILQKNAPTVRTLLGG